MEGNQSVGTVLRRLALVAVLGAAFAASAMVTIWALFQSGEVKVPNTVGMSQEEAQRAIERAGLSVKLRRQHFDTEVPPGTVSEQDPLGGFPVKEGYEVKIDISKGPDPSGKVDEPAPVGPTNPVDGPKPEDAEKKKKKKDEKKDEEETAEAADAKTPAVKAPATADEPGAAKNVEPTKPGEAPKSGETAKPKPGEAAKPASATPKPKPALPKPPPSR